MSVSQNNGIITRILVSYILANCEFSSNYFKIYLCYLNVSGSLQGISVVCDRSNGRPWTRMSPET